MKILNKRKWKYRLKNDLCWKCNEPLLKLDTHYGRKCLGCGFIYQEILLTAYKNREGLFSKTYSIA